MKNALAKETNYLPEVRNQYENYPYPARNPEDEKTQLQYCPLCCLDAMNYYHYSGKRDFAQGFRALVAGGGTGDATIMLAEQLRGTDAEIIHLDLSSASMQVAKNRAEVRKLANISWVQGSLLDVRQMVDGTFDYIDCSGVLHHLASPEAGLAALVSVLKEDGVIGLMLYGKYGRESIYQLQSLMRIINENETDMQHKIENCKAALRNLPATHSFMQHDGLWFDIKQYGDVGIYDLLLHSQDVAYSIPDIYTFLATADLKLTRLDFSGDPKGHHLYQPESYIRDGSLAAIFSGMITEKKQATAELLHGKIMRHSFYAARKQNPVPRCDDLNLVPYLSIMATQQSYAEIYQALGQIAVGQTMTLTMHNSMVNLIKTEHSQEFFKYMDGQKTLHDLFKDIKSSYAANIKKPSTEELKQEFQAIFAAFNAKDWMFLRDAAVPAPRTVEAIQGHVQSLYSSR